jgi:negative regulator of replication initiation
MMPTIRVDDEIWTILKQHAEPFDDTPNDVLRKLLLGSGKTKISASRAQSASNSGPLPNFRPDQDYTHRRVCGFWLSGKHYDVRSFHDLLIEFAREMRKAHGKAFEQAALNLHGTKRAYFSRNAGDLKKPEDVGGTFYVETNLNANILVGICLALLRVLDQDPNDFNVELI